MLALVCLLVFAQFHSLAACGCYGSNSCTRHGHHCDRRTNESCSCDCCPPCNTCEQFLQSHCFAHRFATHYSFAGNQSDLIFKRGETIAPHYYLTDRSTGEAVRYLWNPCLRRALPSGIYLAIDDQQRYQLVGVARDKLAKTSFEIRFKGPVNRLVSVDVPITIV